MLIGRRTWMDAVATAASRRRQPWILIGLLVVMLGGTWIMQGLDVVDGAFFSNRLLSVAAGVLTACAGLALMLGWLLTSGREPP